MPLIRNVSDTARWVAMYRAHESARPDALFHDPWAEKLGGERGRQVLDGMPDGKRQGWPMIVRTAVMDEASRLKRQMPGAWVYGLMALFYPPKMRETMRGFSGYVLLERVVPGAGV